MAGAILAAMFRSDRDALAGQVDDLRAENERLRAQNEAMRTDLLARREAAPAPAGSVYKSGFAHLTPGERAALAVHSLRPFPVWALVLLHVFTLGIFSFVHFNLMHDRLPKAEHDDPSAAKGIGFWFIPYFNLYWMFFNPLRLVDRINLQYRLRGEPDAMPRGIVVAAAVISIIPYFAPLAWLGAAIRMQRVVNRLATPPQEAAVPEAVAAATVPGARFASVSDLPLPEDVAAQAEEEAAAAADPLQRRV